MTLRFLSTNSTADGAPGTKSMKASSNTHKESRRSQAVAISAASSIISRDCAVHHVALNAAWNHIGRVHLARDVGHCVRCDENFRAGVIYDVDGFLRRQGVS
jgi:hypothetical protein